MCLINGCLFHCCSHTLEVPLTAGNLADLQSAMPPPTAAHASQQLALQNKDKNVTRRAAYNALVRLKENEGRFKMLPENLRSKLMEDGCSKVPSELVSMLMDSGNDLTALSATFRAKQEMEKELREQQKLVPMTETQIIAIYGADEAKNVMKSKRALGMVVPDRNNPGKESYLMFQDKKELNTVNRTSTLAL